MAISTPLSLFLLPLLSLVNDCSAAPRRGVIKRDMASLDATYDYIIAGGGTSGLTVADRLTEDPTKSVLVIEYGYLDDDFNVLIPEQTLIGNTHDAFNYTCVPQPGIDNRTSFVSAGSFVGGGSGVNGMFFDRASEEDYNAWEKLGNPGWGWTGLVPYFRKSVTYTPPSAQTASQYGIEYYDESNYGTNGPIQASFPRFQWPGTKTFFKAWSDLGVKQNLKKIGGDAVGLFWVPSSLDPKNQTRSYARTAHYDRVKHRANYHLLTGHKVDKVKFGKDLTAQSVVIRSRDDDSKTTICATREVVLAAGSVNTPLILQRSGIGPKKLLREAGIPVKKDLPGVGANFQDHPVMYMGYNLTNNVYPNPEVLMNNETFNAAAFQQYLDTKTGPYTLARGNTVAFLPLKHIANDYTKAITKVKSQKAANYLPEEYDSTLLAGYKAQRGLLLEAFASDKAAIFELPFTASGTAAVALHKPLSRGTIKVNITDIQADPVVDYGVFINDVDVDNMVRIFKFARKYFNTPTMKQLGPVETLPGASVKTDAQIADTLRSMLVYPSFAHPSCSCAMLPLNKGGVVDPGLSVYGTKSLSIADASVFPLIPATHIQATVYAVAEKAADMIKFRNLW